MYIQETDFKGKWEIHQGMYSYEKITAYIARYTPIYMSQLLGPKLYEKYLAAPTDPCFEAITNPFVEEGNYDWHRGVFGEISGLIISDGLKDMMTGFLYFEIMKDNFTQPTIYGEVRQSGEVSKTTTSLNTLIYNRYNEAVRTYLAIQSYIIKHMADFGGEITQHNMIDFGTGYAVQSGVDLNNISGTGADALIDIIAVDLNTGAITNYEFSNLGRGYNAGDVLVLNAGDINAKIEVESVGTDYKGFNGIRKSYAYWI